MSLADRPRPTLMLVRSILKGHLFAFVWLPRDELTTRRRIAIGEMIEQAAAGRDHQLVGRSRRRRPRLVRYTFNVDAKRPTPDAAALDQQARRDGARLGAERRGGARRAGRRRPRATRLALTYLDQFPEGYRIRTAAEDAARDIVCLVRPRKCRAPATSASSAATTTRATSFHLKIYRLGGDHPAVRRGAGVREFRLPRARGGADPGSAAATTGYIHDFACRCRAAATPRPVLKRGAGGRAGDRRRARGQGRERPVQPADRLRRPRAARGRAVPRLVPLSAPDRPVLLAGHRRRRAAPRARGHQGPDRPVRRDARSGARGRRARRR